MKGVTLVGVLVNVFGMSLEHANITEKFFRFSDRVAEATVYEEGGLTKVHWDSPYESCRISRPIIDGKAYSLCLDFETGCVFEGEHYIHFLDKEDWDHVLYNKINLMVVALQVQFHKPIGPFSYGALKNSKFEKEQRRCMENLKEEVLNGLRKAILDLPDSREKAEAMDGMEYLF